MKILHLSKFYPPVPGGIENFVSDLANAQVKQGHDVYVLSHQADPAAPSVRETVHGVRLERVRIFGHLAYAPVCPGFFFRLRTVIRQFRPDVIHAHVPNVSAFWMLFLRKTCPLVLHWHADVVSSTIDRKLAVLYRIYKPWETSLLQKADAVITTSREYLEHSVPLRMFRPKCHVIPLGMDPERMNPALPVSASSVPGMDGPLFTVLSVGRFAYYKGFQYLAAAAEKRTDARFIIVGDGPEYAAIKQFVAEKGLEKRVLLPGSVDRETLIRLFHECDVFCLPSVERTEAFGLVLLEAMYFGKPLITTRLHGSGVTMVNRHGETGLQVPPEHPEALADAVAFLKAHPESRKKMGEMASRRFLDCFSITSVSREIEMVFNR